MDNEAITKNDLRAILQQLGMPFTPLDYYPIGAYFETSDSTFDPNTVWGGTWVSESNSYVEDITTRNVEGTIGHNFGSSATLSAPNIAGYTFVQWTNVFSNTWVGTIYPANPTVQNNAYFFVSTYASPGGTGSFVATALYKKVVTKYRWHRTS